MARRTPRVLTDEQWELTAPHLPRYPPSPKGGRPRADDRECLQGILWLLRTGARWRDIPIDMPSGSTCWRRLRDWAAEGVLEDVQAALVQVLDELGKLDLRSPTRPSCAPKKGARRSAKRRLAR